ncbi:MAG: acyl-CoA desaturase [Kiritimatiellaceae bacterium]|jgi:stearoyl-CoA desaturase (delta-9 desaturase)|nr:acyl-CoA desaturase [Kiritimatiellaceae bacterium]|tara:strand:+ start:2681 stop:3544 length:864 start_codon:yes stop_codon:yes gene_type:complete
MSKEAQQKNEISYPLILMHLGCLGIFFVPFSTSMLLVFLTIYCLHVFTLTAGYHRYFSHKSFKTSRIFQFILAFLGTMAAQKDPLWWASHHRLHHEHADSERDPHSPRHGGFWWAHIGWVMQRKLDDTRYDKIKDFTRFPELMWLNRNPFLPALLLAAALFVVGLLFQIIRPEWGISGIQLLIYGFFLSTVAVYHVTFCINSVAHRYGSRRYAVDDDSVNNWLLAILTNGEGWHNNHHRYAVCARQGFRWWELDVSYLILRTLQFFRIVWDIREPPRSILGEKSKAA